MRSWRRWTVAVGVFLLVFLIVFTLGFIAFFPADSLRTWIGSWNIPGKTSVARVRLDPLMRLKLEGLDWRLDKNPLVKAVEFKRIVIRPAWSRLLLGNRVFYLAVGTGGGEIRGTVMVKKEHLLFSVTTPKPAALSAVLVPRPGVLFRGNWTIAADVDVNLAGGARGVSGGCLFKAKDLRFRWATSPVGAVDVSFVSGLLKGDIAGSVLNLGEIRFRGNMLDVEGSAVVWPDPVSQDLHAKGNLYLRPKVGLGSANASLDAAIRVLPKDARGYKLAF